MNPKFRASVFAQNLGAIRWQLQFTQEQAAAFVGLPRTTWALLEKHGSNPCLSTVIKILGAFGVTLDEMLSHAGSRERNAMLARLHALTHVASADEIIATRRIGS